MTDLGSDNLLAVFLIFCRVGSCIMVLPGFSSQHVPARVRLLMAMGCTLALAPPLMTDIQSAASKIGPSDEVMLIASEVTVGLLIGLCGRCFFMALEFVAAATTTFLGYSGTPGTPIEDTEPGGTLATMITLTATVLIFISDLHLEVIKALVASYSVIEVRPIFATEMALKQISAVSSKAFLVALQVGGPFMIYSIVANLLFGLTNKLTPQVPIYYISIPFIIMGGLAILVLVIPDFLALFMTAFSRWLVTGAP